MSSNYKKRVRLKNFDYKGCHCYFLTLCAFNKRPVFKNNAVVNWLVDALKEKSISSGFKIWAYCFMPDHLHLLIEGKDLNSDMKFFISSYKQHTGYHYKQKNNLPLWQISFYEHVLRKEEDLMSVAYYIFGNPVRKNLISDYRQYKFLGSFEFDITQT